MPGVSYYLSKIIEVALRAKIINHLSQAKGSGLWYLDESLFERSDYYEDFKRSDESYDSAPVMKMSWLTHNLLGAIDYERAKMKREENYRTLHSILGGSNRLPTKNSRVIDKSI